MAKSSVVSNVSNFVAGVFRAANPGAVKEAQDTPVAEYRTLTNKHIEYTKAMWDWEKIRIALAGSDKVKEHDLDGVTGRTGVNNLETFLLRPEGQSNEEYKFYVLNARYWNVTARTLSVLEGLFLYKEPRVIVPASMEGILSNMDKQGSSCLDMISRAARECLSVGRAGYLIDYPRVFAEGGLTRKELKQNNISPYMIMYNAEDILDWDDVVIKNVTRLAYVTVRETPGKDDRIRVLALEPYEYTVDPITGELTEEPASWRYHSVTYELFRTQATRFVPGGRNSGYRVIDDTYPTDFNGEYFDEIPFRFLGVHYDQRNVQRPTLLDLVDLSIDHYRKSADVSSALFHCAHPTPVFCGFNLDSGEKIRLGARQGISTTDPAAHASYLELNGQSINEIRKEREAIVLELASTGARLLTNSNDSNTTAETSRIRASGDTAIMNVLSETLGQAFTEALALMARFLGETGNISVDMSKEFMPYRMDSQDVIALVNAYQANALPIEDLLEAFKAGGVIRQSRLSDEYQEDLASTVANRGAYETIMAKARSVVTPAIPAVTSKTQTKIAIKGPDKKDDNSDPSGSDIPAGDVNA